MVTASALRGDTCQKFLSSPVARGILGDRAFKQRWKGEAGPGDWLPNLWHDASFLALGFDFGVPVFQS